jgi:membrane protease YdiL (CAAX protease family)
VINQALVALAWPIAGDGRTYADFTAAAYAFIVPSGLLAANLAVAALAPICWLLVVVLHRRQPWWLSSVRPRLRWRYLLICIAPAVLVFVGSQLLMAPGSTAWTLQPGAVAFLAVIVATTPLQAAAEEIVFRGYLLQAFGSLVRGRWFAVVASALVFALLHGAQSPAMFLDRLSLGLLAGVLVVRTGGLEAAIAAHVVNNVYTYADATLTTSVSAVHATSEITSLDAVRDVGSFTVFVIAALLLARWLKLRSRVGRASGPAARSPARARLRRS